MANQNNPAGRLHTLLTAYRSLAGDNSPVHDVWARVLEVETADDLYLTLCEVASLLPAIESLIERSGQEELTQALNQHRRAWSLPILSTDKHPREAPGPGADYVDPAALVALGVVSALLDATTTETRELNSTEMDSIRQQIGALLEELTNTPGMPSDLKAAISARLHDISWALDHYRIKGPDGVAAAMERLVGELALLHRAADTSGEETKNYFSHLYTVIQLAWKLFRKGPEASHALEGWTNFLAALPPGQ